ncbi:hypothetical protein B0H13DRAFT_1867665 [Mycena leptocephala]|nr:hypothetical protein B0H13DRAFT_1867665 [Mycena leptocephala]
MALMCSGLTLIQQYNLPLQLRLARDTREKFFVDCMKVGRQQDIGVEVFLNSTTLMAPSIDSSRMKGQMKAELNLDKMKVTKVKSSQRNIDKIRGEARVAASLLEILLAISPDQRTPGDVPWKPRLFAFPVSFFPLGTASIMVVANAEIPLEALSAAEGGTPTPSGSSLAWEEQLSRQLSQLSSDVARLRHWSLHTSHESELARFRQWTFHSQILAPNPLLSDKSHDFWDLEIINQARDMSDFRAGLRAAPTEDALIRSPPGEGYHDREDVDNPLAGANYTSREFELARFRQWTFHSQTLGPSPLLPDKSHDFWDLEIIDQAREMSDFRAGLRAALTEDALIRCPPGEGYRDREDVDNPLAGTNYTSREFELACFRQWTFHSQTLGPSSPLPDKSHDFWDLELIHQGRNMSDFRAGLHATPTEDTLIRYPTGEGYHDREEVDNPLAEAVSDPRDANSPSRESELEWSHSQTPALSPPLPDKSNDFGTLKSSTKPTTCPISGLGFIGFPWPEDYHHTEDVGNPLAETNSRLRESLLSLTSDSLATQDISSWGFGSSTFGGPCSIGIAQQASSSAMLRNFRPEGLIFWMWPHSDEFGISACDDGLPTRVLPPLGDIMNSEAHDVGLAQSWKEQCLVRVQQVLTSPTDHDQIRCPRQDVKEYPDADDHRDSHSGLLTTGYSALYPRSFGNSQTSRGVEAKKNVCSTARYGSPRHLEQASDSGYARFLPQSSSTPNRATQRPGLIWYDCSTGRTKGQG